LYPEFGQIEKMIITGAKGSNPWNSYIPYPVFKNGSPKTNYKMFEVDNNKESVDKVKEIFFSNPNISFGCQSSELYLHELIDIQRAIGENDNALFYLDAHWGDYWPLREEINEVLKLKKFAIVIDDFVVPGHPDCGYDSYRGIPCGWGFIKDLFKGREVSVFYPTRSNRDYRGWVLIIAGYSSEELQFLKKLPLFKLSRMVLFRTYIFNFGLLFSEIYTKIKIWLYWLVSRNQKVYRLFKKIQAMLLHTKVDNS
jgi:hypothetical protein